MIEPALPKKTLGRNSWTKGEVDILMSMAAEFTDQGKRIRWREIANATGHHEKSCALKYHTLRSRAAGCLTRDLVDADLALKDPVTPTRPTTAGAYPVWSADEDARLLAACQGKAISGNAAWQKIAEGFPGRSFCAVRQRHLTLRQRADGIERDRAYRTRAKPQIRTVPDRKNKPDRPQRAEHLTLTSALLGDPLPGRSALDRRRAGIGDDELPSSYHTRWESRIANRPKITLATEPMR
jgi:hypothetical protein